jgi:general stress protein 26
VSKDLHSGKVDSSARQSDEEFLRSAQLIHIATQRRNGGRSTSRPVWFMYDQGKLFFTTSPTSWKARRIAAGSPLLINVGRKDGPFFVGHAESVRDPALIDRMGQAYARKYWLARLGLFRPRSDRVAAGKTCAYLVTLSKSEPHPT